MEKRELICIGCPMGCPLTVTLDGGAVVTVQGNTCPRGDAYARREVTAPTRIVTTTVRVTGGALPAVSCKTRSDIPKEKIFDVVRNYAHKAFPGFNGRPCNVGGDDAIFCPHKNAVLNHRLNLEGVDCRTAEVTAFECLKQIFFNHNTASCRVYEQCTLFHFGKGIFVKHIFRLWI